MIDPAYLAAGLNAMARAHLVNGMAGHLGAAVVAGCFIAEDHPDLEEEVCRGIEGEMERIIRGESVFSPGSDAGISAPDMFQPFADGGRVGEPTGCIAAALEGNIAGLRQ